VLAAVLVSAPLSFHYLLVAGGPAVPAYLLGLIDRAQFLRDRDLVTPAVDWIHRQTPEEARIWAWCEDRTLYLDRWTRSDPPFGPPAFLATLAQDGPETLTAAADKVDLIVVRRDRCPASWDEARFEKNRYPIGDGERSALAAWTAEHLAEVARDDRYTVYRVVR
jgi:hypothetical protein